MIDSWSARAILAVLLLVAGCVLTPPPARAPLASTPDITSSRDGIETQVDSVLRQQPLMDAIADRYPKEWNALVDALVQIDQHDKPGRETKRVIQAFRHRLTPRLRSLTSNMPDSLLTEFFQIRAQTYEWHAVHQPTRCEQALEGGAAGRAGMVRLYDMLPSHLRRRHIDMMVRIVRQTPRQFGEAIARPETRTRQGGSPDVGIGTSVTADESQRLASFDNALSIRTRRLNKLLIPEQPSGCAAMAMRLRNIALLSPIERQAAYRRLLPRKMPGKYRIPATVAARQESRTVMLSGRMGVGTAQRLRAVLATFPTVNTLVLDSDGGLLSEGFALAKAVRQYELNTRVIDSCASACTIAFLAGKRRQSHPAAKIGFHRPGSAGFENEPTHLFETIADYRRLYHNRRISDAFLERVARTPSVTVWYPSWQILIENRIVTDMVPGMPNGTMDWRDR